ncbi:glutamate receptor ionotropic, kainate 2-like [Watersipora subatra]|uniref:glutamate receptor ionotropic, kainate 2-like n=1 Tax=Watersipora subatra TaxID=2589382 RepID=UPI00355BC159
MIQSTPDFSSIRSEAEEYMSRMKISVFPEVDMLSQALLDFVREFSWKKILVLYQGSEGLVRIKAVINSGFYELQRKREKIDVLYWEINDIEKTLKELRTNVNYKHIIVDIQTDQIAYFLDVAARMGILTSYHHYMFTSLDLAAINIGGYTLGGVNITGYSLVNTTGRLPQNLRRQWVESSLRPRAQVSSMLLTRNALVIDSVRLFALALNAYLDGLSDFETKSINCQSKSSDEAWDAGDSIYNQFSSVQYEGLSGPIRIDKGRRSDFHLNLIEYDNEGNVQLLGYWNKSNGLNITKSEDQILKEVQKELNNKTLRVVVKEEHPFIIVNRYDDSGNPIPEDAKGRYTGYAIDMMDEIAKGLNITYTTILVPDGSSGRELPNGTWTGMIGMLMTNKADLALGDLTINFERSKVIDFTKPFMSMGISILFKRPEPDPPKLFSFLEPLDNNIWACMIGSYAFVSVFLFCTARFSPYEWKNPHPCNPESDIVENDFTLLNSFWFTIGSLMQQGCELAPKASSTRLIAGVWWFFTLILISSYTANLAAFLTITRMSTPIQNADDLSKQTTIKYGCQYGGSTYSFFENSKIPTYEKMWNFMSQNPDVFVNTSDVGIAKVKSGKYAYLMESIPLRYQLSQHCELMEVGGELDSKGYGIGVPRESPYRDILSNEILSLSERQVLLNLYNKWWNVDNTKCKVEDDSKASSTAAQLGLPNLGGVFVFLLAGLLLAFVIAILEFVINAFINSRADKQTLWSEIREECMFAIKCWGPSEKSVNKYPHVNGNAGAEDLDDLEASQALKPSVMDTSFR